ncbi:hypothetical protein M2D63_007645 [Pseudomonas sp. BJa5]|uniref:hypothetical protein n=1 Tax=Pseudomonas sp. BJa5 TaxID=2936270 RepID=UPI0025599EBE|nr:hypothetical protein [Pseudomonas sp. BGr12]MDL2420981.1 hypothetical protein [Pseudomonas sp. BGr12]
MNASAKEKLGAWLKRPRGSFGAIAGVGSFVVLVSIASAFEGVAQLLTARPWVLAGFIAISLGVGVIVQHRYTVLVGKAIFAPGASGWRNRVGRMTSWARESNLVLCLLLAVAVGYPATLYFAARSLRTIVAACETNLNDQLAIPGEGGRSLPIAAPVCQCLAQVFLDRNGMVRLALFETAALEVTDYQGISEEDEQHCLDAVLAHGAGIRASRQ